MLPPTLRIQGWSSGLYFRDIMPNFLRRASSRTSRPYSDPAPNLDKMKHMYILLPIARLSALHTHPTIPLKLSKLLRLTTDITWYIRSEIFKNCVTEYLDRPLREKFAWTLEIVPQPWYDFSEAQVLCRILPYIDWCETKYTATDHQCLLKNFVPIRLTLGTFILFKATS